VVLLMLQIASFIFMSMQVAKLDVKLDSRIRETRENFVALMETYDASYQENFQEITNILTRQQEDFKQEISLLKSAQNDFSGIVEESVKAVVRVTTGRSIGSGFIINQEGYLVTNYHVIVGNENKVRVLTYDRQILPAEFIGHDEVRDLALLKVDGQYPWLELADSDSLQVGKKVIAIGNPLGLSFTVTEGIISALNRKGPNGLEDYIQTDVSLNPGNSGGPLIDTQGKVVGINNFKIGGAESLGFALESNAIKNTVNQIGNQTIVP
jgi:serine protease Do